MKINIHDKFNINLKAGTILSFSAVEKGYSFFTFNTLICKNTFNKFF